MSDKTIGYKTLETGLALRLISESSYVGRHAVLDGGGARTTFLFHAADGRVVAIAPKEQPLVGEPSTDEVFYEVHDDAQKYVAEVLARIEDCLPAPVVEVRSFQLRGRNCIRICFSSGYAMAFVGKMAFLMAAHQQGGRSS